jgi:hypothetical protein
VSCLDQGELFNGVLSMIGAPVSLPNGAKNDRRKSVMGENARLERVTIKKEVPDSPTQDLAVKVYLNSDSSDWIAKITQLCRYL